MPELSVDGAIVFGLVGYLFGANQRFLGSNLVQGGDSSAKEVQIHEKEVDEKRILLNRKLLRNTTVQCRDRIQYVRPIP